MANKYRIKKQNGQDKIISEINVVPYIDVMLVLLVIFMVTAPLMYQEINVNLPETSSSEEQNTEENFIAIDVINENTFNVNYSGELENSISSLPFKKISNYMKNNKLSKIFIRSDENIQYGHLINIMDNLKKNGINNIGLITEKKDE